MKAHTVAAVIATSVVALAGCGGGGGDDTSGGGGGEGKELFTSKCGACHTLADAGTSGAVGPNLDELQPDKSRVSAMIASGGGGMPSGLASGADADAIATYVSENAGK